MGVTRYEFEETIERINDKLCDALVDFGKKNSIEDLDSNFTTTLTDNKTYNIIGTSIITPTLGSAVGVAGLIERVINSSTVSQTVETTGSETISGGASVVLNSTDSLVVQSDGANWIRI